MSKNPYKVLGVSPDATDEEIKQAYRELVRKYHPDRHRDSGLEDLASEKMKEINAAHEEIQRQRAQKSSGDASGSYQSTNAGGYNAGSQNRSQYSYEAQAKFTTIRNCINNNNITEAERLLAEISVNDRGAEWHFLNGCVLMRKGYYVDAQHAFDTACRMEPTNNEYFRFRDQMSRRSGQFGGGYQTGRQSNGCCDCDMCTTLICADCCCEMMGGDLIRCC